MKKDEKDTLLPLYIVCDWTVIPNTLSNEKETSLYLFRKRPDNNYDLLMRVRYDKTISKILLKETFNNIYEYGKDNSGWTYASIIPGNIKHINKFCKFFHSDEELIDEYFWALLA